MCVTVTVLFCTISINVINNICNQPEGFSFSSVCVCVCVCACARVRVRVRACVRVNTIP